MSIPWNLFGIRSVQRTCIYWLESKGITLNGVQERCQRYLMMAIVIAVWFREVVQPIITFVLEKSVSSGVILSRWLYRSVVNSRWQCGNSYVLDKHREALRMLFELQ